MFWVYILRCADGTLYVGHTNDILRRQQDHNEGRGGRHTAARRPVRMVYTERHVTLESACDRERQLKQWTVAKKQALIAGDVKKLKRFAQRREQRPSHR